MKTKYLSIREKDNLYLWHAYTQHKTEQAPIPIVKGKKALLWDDKGKKYIDGIASWWVNPFGHTNKQLAKAAYRQLISLEHVLFGGFTHQPAADLAEKLIYLLPENQQKVFFSDNGSTSVEVAIKMALQFYYNKNEKRNVIIAFEDAFHGDTFAAMAVSGISLYTKAFEGQLLKVVRIPVPTKGREEESAIKLEQAIRAYNPAAFIFEPLVLGAAGMIMYSPEALDTLISICYKNNVLTIADEVMTGFGKTGKLFACSYLNENPDIICLSKALTGGTIPLAATTTTQEVFNAFYDDDISKALFHGHTFMANPTGCAIALESIKLFQDIKIERNLQRINKQHLQFAKKMKRHPKVADIRTLGVIFALDLKVKPDGNYYGTIRNVLYNFFISKGIILRPVYNTIYILPCYVITNPQLQEIYNAIEEAISMLEKKGYL
ncbi:adenosylmethionine--8-amino-7-oxononanoate transaminase [Capnocytophaga catalasegens]|uniref:Adenosylmethionine-8-amino-7-oxononanoate aminotransferase n=1 Tax=Capnocytophaga catalasegens TaxID=1004260 RepID=A0AAV5B069_9FLAO|nr:adenosylmethionine--8-amino-7-oxononanoate transaminase [Capnocytophaga catalasegens]GIZ15370.1 adenosylmethionine--8-amino-7-oxononanoate aminotransferase BioA [Capnocytophaga catalasegens]GJM50958.1 adenosylmethionine--8-amino-7-oxononanoate aminotransferase BioA [Capnocytophaga catalasegens]GJM52142.1 adenosylmethionine--8-amino-7-oxononanoate aminotransferase BioA [Capnocytophaga catalasegens]